MKFTAVLLLFTCTHFATRFASAAVGDFLYKLRASDGAMDAEFGWSVDISGNTAIVGAWQDDDNGFRSGSVYLFDVVTGDQLLKIIPSDGTANGQFGVSVSISDDKLIVGARGSKTNVNASGAAYVFDVATGAQLAKFSSSNDAGGDYFGWSVDISGNIAIVSAERDEDNGTSSGAAYLFDVATGTELFKLTASDGAVADHFGISVAVNGTTAIVGAYGDRDNGAESGSAYLFDVTTGAELAKLIPSDGAAEDRFGWSVGISGNTAIVGAWRHDDNGSDSGSAGRGIFVGYVRADLTRGEQCRYQTRRRRITPIAYHVRLYVRSLVQSNRRMARSLFQVDRTVVRSLVASEWIKPVPRRRPPSLASTRPQMQSQHLHATERRWLSSTSNCNGRSTSNLEANRFNKSCKSAT